MKTETVFRFLLLPVCLLFYNNLRAVTIHVETAGTLSSLVPESEKYEITELTLTGNLNGLDILFIREMAGGGYSGGHTGKGKLSILNLADAHIVADNYNEYYFYQGSSIHYPGFKTSWYTKDNSISGFMFAYCVNLTHITLPNSVTAIECYAFSACTGLTGIDMPDNVTFPFSEIMIGNFAFQNCTSLTEITIPDGCPSIGYGTFHGCSGLACITIPNSVTSIEYRAFYNCSSLTNITIPNNVTDIKQGAFYGCTGLIEITIPDGCTSIAGETFRDCTRLTSIVIPDNLKEIGTYAFYNCISLTSITIPNGVNEIYGYTFYNCINLMEIYVHNDIPPFIANSSWEYSFSVFANVDFVNCKLYVPAGSKDAYKKANRWQLFVNIIEENLTSIPEIHPDNLNIRPVAGGLSVETKDTTPIVIYLVSGQKIYQAYVNGIMNIPLNKGVYIVQAKNKNQKIIIQ